MLRPTIAFIREQATKLRTWWWIPALLLVNFALSVLFPPDYWLFRKFSVHAPKIVLAYFVFALILLILRQTRLMMIAFACCAGMCIYLQQAAQGNEAQEFRYGYAQPTNEAQLRIVQFNTQATDGEFEKNIQRIANENADIIAVHEVTPDWDDALQDLLIAKYPHYRSFPQADFSGLALFSKLPLSRIDVFDANKIPNIIAAVKIDDKHPDVYVVVAHAPPIDEGYESIRTYMSRLLPVLNQVHAPLLVASDYNMVSWSSEVQNFLSKTGLKDGRRAVEQDLPSPTDYIFYSQQFNCLGFEALRDKETGTPIGIKGAYQFKTDFRVQ